MSNKLTPRQENFCQAFVRLGDKSAAYREAYSTANMKPESINRKAFSTFELVNVRARIRDLQEKCAKIADERFNVTSEKLIRHLEILRNARIDEYIDFISVVKKEYDDEGRVAVEYNETKMVFKPFDQLTKEQLMCIESVKETRYGIELKLHGKEWTIEKLAKHIGFYEKDNLQKSNIFSSEDRAARLAELKSKLEP